MSDANWDAIKGEREQAKRNLEEAEKYFEAIRQLPIMLGKIFDENMEVSGLMNKSKFIEVVTNLLNKKNI